MPKRIIRAKKNYPFSIVIPRNNHESRNNHLMFFPSCNPLTNTKKNKPTTPQTTMTDSSLINNSMSFQRNERTIAWTHSPVVLAMLDNNKMENCRDVQEIFAECLATSSKDRICKTATHYFGKCARSYEEGLP